jgi:thioredoxin reductase (NADPH)
MGPQLMNDMTAQAERFGAKIIYEEITRVDFSKSPYKLWAGDQPIESKTVIIATGATAKTLNLPEEGKLMGRGLSTCATCDGFFYKNKPVAVVGGGDTAMEEANYLAKLCSKVYLIHRRDVFRASNVMLQRAKENPKIEFLVPYGVEAPLHDASGVIGARLRHVESGEAKDIKVDAVFMAIGHTPNSSVFKDWIDTDANGYVKVDHHARTKVPGVFAAGDIADHTFRQAITAAGMGCQAAMLAIRYLEEQGA